MNEQWGMWSDRAGWVLAALILGFAGADALYLGHFSVWTLGCRLVWALSLVASSVLIRRSPPFRARLLSDLNAAIWSVCILGICLETGGLGSPYFLLVPVLPVAIAFMYRNSQRASLMSGGVGCVGTVGFVWWAEYGLIQALTWVSIVVAITLYARFFAERFHQVQQSEERARLERARLESLEALALSEHRRTQSEKLAIVGRLASGVAHEINNPLAYVGSNVDFVRDELRSAEAPSREELLEVLEETRSGLQHIRRIVADLKGFARMDAEEPTECALADVVADAVKLASLRLKHVAWLRVDVPVALPEIFVVRQRLVQVVINLLVNAGDALEAHQVENGEVRVTGQSDGSQVVLLVEDNGPGFAPHVLPRLFEAFFTTKGPDKGTGLGLNLSRELVEQFGGVLSADNRPEGGARLRLEFPARRADSSPSSLPENEERDAA